MPQSQQNYLLRFEDDIPYTDAGIAEQSLDLIRPVHPEKRLRPLIVYIHDGAWQKGDKTDGHNDLALLVRSGNYIAASVNYRLTDKARWPAQLHDCKAAIRWLRAHSSLYGIDPERIAVWGKSAGAYLALMLGATATNPAFKGVIGQYHNFSTKISAVINCSGIVDLNTLPGQPSELDHDAPNSPEARLIGGPLSKFVYAAKDASPLSYVTPKMPAVLSIHSLDDKIIPFAQSQALHEKLNFLNLSNVLIPVKGAKHGEFPADTLSRIRSFLDRELLGLNTEINTDTMTMETLQT